MWRAIQRWALLGEASVVIKAGPDVDPSGYAQNSDLRTFLEEDAAEVAEALRGFLTRQPRPRPGGRGRPELDATVAAAVASLHWYRYLLLEDGTADDLASAISLFRQLFAVDPGLVPALLVPLFDPGVGEPAETPEDLDLLALCAIDLFALVEAGDKYEEHAIALTRRALGLSHRLDSVDPGVRLDLAAALYATFDHTQDPGVLDDALAHARKALSETPPDQEEWLDGAGQLGHILVGIADSRSDDRALREALGTLRPAVRAAGRRHPYIVRAATALFRAVTLHLNRNWSGPVLATAVEELRRLLKLVPEDFDGWSDMHMVVLTTEISHLLWLGNLPAARQVGSAIDRLHSRLGPETPDRDRVRLVLVALSRPRQHAGDDEVLDILRDLTTEGDVAFAVSLFEWLHAIDPGLVPALLAPLYDPDVPERGHGEDDVFAMASWSTHLFTYAEAAGDGRQHRAHAVALARRAASVGRHLDRIDPAVRFDLAHALWRASEHTEDGALLDDALTHARAAVTETPPDQEEWLARLVLLGQALVDIADARNDGEALREALVLLRPAVLAAGPHHPHKVNAAVVTAGAVSLSLSQNWDSAHLADGAAEIRQLLELIPETFTGRDTLAGFALVADVFNLFFLGDMGGALTLRPALDDLIGRAEPGSAHHDRLCLTRASLSPLWHLARAEPAPQDDLAHYRDVLHSATALDPVERAAHLEALGIVLVAQAELAGDREVLEDCVRLLTDGLRTFPDGSAEYRALGATLGSALLIRFHQIGDRADLDGAITLLRQGLSDLPTGRDWVPSVLGQALSELHLSTGDQRAYHEALGLLRASASDAGGVLTTRLHDALAAGQLAGGAGRWDDAADVLADGVSLAARLAWRGMTRVDQEANLASHLTWRDRIRWQRSHQSESGAVNEAAAATTRAGDAARAAELLEAGRAILLHQTLDVRSEIAGVRAGLPDLAARLDQIQQGIDSAADRRERYDLAREWDRLVAEIRSRPGFARFLRSPELPALLPRGQTVVLVNPAGFGSDAFLVTASGVQVVPLPALRTADLKDRIAAFHRALADRARASTHRQRQAALAVIDDTLDWLWSTTAEPVLDALGHVETPPETGLWPHLHWCPTSMLSFLPLHAAAARRRSPPGHSVLDRVVSSYALSLRTLRFVSQRPDPPPNRQALLVVSLPETPGLPALPGARLESAALAGLSTRTRLFTGAEAVHDAVSMALRDHAWTHFACHAAQDLQNPSSGRLLLHDHRTNPLTVLDISRLRLDHAQLAFLSACDTARGGLRLPDEALHLGGALQLAGYQHVIATLWQINDRVAAMVTAQVYDQLHTPGTTGLAPARSALALHRTMRALRRRYPDDPSLWASYVHLGP